MSDGFHDNFTEAEVLQCLHNAGLRYKDGGRYITTQCPTHTDSSPSAQVFKNDWFVNCLAKCGRYHITKAFPELLPDRMRSRTSDFSTPTLPRHQIAKKEAVIEAYKDFDLFDTWHTLPLIPRDHEFKGLPLEILDDLGWRWAPEGVAGMAPGYFIPYFDVARETIPFAQVRHLSGDRRFTFLKDARPTTYGKWNLNNPRLFVVEGASDCATLQHCGVPWVGMPSASSGTILKDLAKYCKAKGIQLVYAGDKDEAGDKLKEALGEVMSFRTCQPPGAYKDWGEFYFATDAETVFEYCKTILFE